MKITKQKVQAVADLKAGYTLGHADVAILNELASIALASLEAEPAGWQVKKYGGNWVSIKNEDVDHYRFNEELPVREVYTAPPAPVSMPDAIEPTVEAVKRILPTSNPDDYAACIGADMWNACRAAMLQGADGALTNEDTKKMDELVMWIKRLAHSLRKASPDSKLQSDAMDYLSRKGLIGVKDILR